MYVQWVPYIFPFKPSVTWNPCHLNSLPLCNVNTPPQQHTVPARTPSSNFPAALSQRRYTLPLYPFVPEKLERGRDGGNAKPNCLHPLGFLHRKLQEP